VTGPPSSIRIVPADAEHAEFVRGLSAVVFRRFGDYAGFLPRLMRRPEVRTVLAVVGGRPVGFAMISLETLRGGEIDLAAIAVEPAWQSRGIGRALLRHVDEQAQGLAAPGREALAVRLSVAADNERARRVFEAAGFRPVRGGRGRYPAGQPSLTLRKVPAAGGLDSGASGKKLG
jgi:ribosomal-protein-alanine N-acetyltransferase